MLMLFAGLTDAIDDLVILITDGYSRPEDGKGGWDTNAGDGKGGWDAPGSDGKAGW